MVLLSVPAATAEPVRDSLAPTTVGKVATGPVKIEKAIITTANHLSFESGRDIIWGIAILWLTTAICLNSNYWKRFGSGICVFYVLRASEHLVRRMPHYVCTSYLRQYVKLNQGPSVV